jgi:hypothetical protein
MQTEIHGEIGIARELSSKNQNSFFSSSSFPSMKSYSSQKKVANTSLG